MAKPHKTIPVRRIVGIVNRRNELSTCDSHIRDGWNSLLEEILHETDNYRGSVYLTENDIPKGHLPGRQLPDNGIQVFPDESRLRFIEPCQ